MTANALIDRLDALQPNAYTRAEKQAWVRRLHGILMTQVWEGCTEAPKLPESAEGELPVEENFAELYLRYLQAQVDLANGELDRYLNSAALFNSILSGYRNYYFRTHCPKSRGWVYF